MDQAISSYIMPDYKVIELAAVAMAADAEFLGLLAATPDAIGADDAAIAAILEAHHEACVALAACRRRHWQDGRPKPWHWRPWCSGHGRTRRLWTTTPGLQRL